MNRAPRRRHRSGPRMRRRNLHASPPRASAARRRVVAIGPRPACRFRTATRPWRMRRTGLVAPLLLLLTAAPARAQFRADPGIVVNGLVTVTVQVTLYDLDAPYVPLARYRLVLHGPQRDSTVLQTNDAGVVSIGRPTGTYRLVSETPVLWKGATYRWDLPVVVRPYMRAVDLNPGNAIVTRPPAAARRAG